MKAEGLISVNGALYPPENAHISVLDRGLLFADDIFEVLVAFQNKILNTAQHLQRLRHSAAQLYMEIPWSDQELTFEMQSLVEQLGYDKIYLRLMLSRDCGLGLKPQSLEAKQKIIYALKAPMERPEVYSQGLRLKRKALSYTLRGAKAKTGNYQTAITALIQASQEHYDDVVFSNDSGEFTEASTANIFFIGRSGDLVEIATPSTQSGILEGVTRQTLIHLCHKAKIPVTERIVYVDELARFDEAFLTSTVRGLVPIAQIDAHRFKTTRPNAVFHHLQRLYLTWVETELGYRIDWRTGRPTKT